MHHASTIFALGTLGLWSVVPACSVSNNDVGSLQHDGSASGGTSGSGGISGSTGASGGISGTGGAAPSLTCTYQGKTYAVGESFKLDCNTCTCGALGDTLVRCTVMACLGTGGAPAGTGGQPGSGGATGSGGTTATADGGGQGQTCTYNGKTYPNDVTWASADGCHLCWCLGETGVCDAAPPCGDGGVPNPETQCTYEGASYPMGTVFPSKDGCNICECSWKFAYYQPACTLNACPGLPVVDGGAGADACVYHGATYPSDTHFSAVDGCNECHCRSDGQVMCTLKTCVRDGGVNREAPTSDVPPPPDLPPAPDVPLASERLPVDVGGPNSVDVAVLASACAECGPDELCVGYYDGTCKALSTSCNKVSATTRISILLNHERCFSNPMGDEICGTRDGQHFWGCGEPACPAQTLVADVNCYGP